MATRTNTTPPAESVRALIRKRRKLNKIVYMVNRDSVAEELLDTVADLRLDIARAPAKTAQDIAAKALFFIHDYVDVGPNPKFAVAMRAGLKADLQRLGGAA